MFYVYTVSKFNDRYQATRVRKNLTKEEAMAFKAERVANPRCTCKYVVVAESKLEAFWAEVHRASAVLAKQWEAMEEVKAKRWEQLDEMYRRGYKVSDTVAFLNR